jgi:hypothetical protein
MNRELLADGADVEKDYERSQSDPTNAGLMHENCRRRYSTIDP